MRGVFITFEGGEGCGKTTQIKLLAEKLRALGREVVITLEPGATGLGRELRKLLLAATSEPPVPLAELMLYGADRAQHLARVVRPALEAGRVVLCDRYADATEAYQGWGRGIDNDTVSGIIALATQGLMPHRTLVLDLDPIEGVGRSLNRQANSEGPDESRFELEDPEFHAQVRTGYRAIANREPARVRWLDGSLTIPQVEELVWTEIADLFESAAG